VISGDLPTVSIQDPVRKAAELVPDALALAILIPGTFDLIGGGDGTPDKFIWEMVDRIFHNHPLARLFVLVPVLLIRTQLGDHQGAAVQTKAREGIPPRPYFNLSIPSQEGGFIL
jgi:hypothetical protein